MRAPSLLVAAVLLAAPSQAQQLIHTLEPPIPVEWFGTAVANVPDTDGDGISDLLVGGREVNGGRAFLYSGATGDLLRTFVSPNAPSNDSFATTVAGVPDVDGDGYGDLLIGASGESTAAGTGAGRAYVFSGASGLLLHQLESANPQAFGYFGYAVAGVADADGDGRGDLLVGARREDHGDVDDGKAYLFSGATGTLLHALNSPNIQTFGYFGRSVAGVPDADGDGRGDLLVGAYHEAQGGRAYLFSGASATLLHEFISPHEMFNGAFGWSVAGVPDVDGDGRGDVLIGAYREHDGAQYAGRAYAFSGAAGNLLYELVSQSPEGFGEFGHAVAGVPDADGDGRGDLLVGAWKEHPARAYLFSGADGAFRSAVEVRRPGVAQPPPALAGVEDLNGDGLADLLVGVTPDLRAYIYSGRAPALVASPLLLDFGPLYVGTTSPPRPVLVSNTSSTALTLTTVSLGGADPDEFEVTSMPPLPLVLQPGEAVTVEAVFAPTREGPAEASLTVASSDGNAVVTLEGMGQEDLIVTTTADTDDGSCDAHCSLREATLAALTTPYDDRITFAPELADRTITLTQGELVIYKRLVIDGEDRRITIDGGGTTRVFNVLVEEAGGVEIRDVTISGGSANHGGGLLCEGGILILDRVTIRGNAATSAAPWWGGGGAFIDFSCDVTIRNSTITANTSASSGGGIRVHSCEVNEIVNTTISGNTAYRGAGIFSGWHLEERGSPRSPHATRGVQPEGCGLTRLRNVTVTDNHASTTGGGLDNMAVGAVNFSGSVIAGNTAGGDPAAPTADCVSVSASAALGHSVVGQGTGCPTIGTDVSVPPADVFTQVLSPLLDHNGGPTRTHALVYDAANPALDIGGTCGPTDQRGLPAPVDGPDPDTEAACDAGSVEQGAPVFAFTLTPEDPPVVIPGEGGAFRFTVTATNLTAEPQPLRAWARATRPGGAETPVLLGPVTAVLGPGATATRSVRQRVSGFAPAGAWTYAGYAEEGPGGAVVSDRFTVTKEGATARQRPSQEGEAGWPVAVYAESSAPVAAGDVWTGEPPPLAPGASALPAAYALHGVRPNPFASRALLAYDLPEAAAVRLVLYDVLGRVVAVLVDAEREAGRHEVVLDASGLPSGTYLVRLASGEVVRTRRLTVVR